MTNGLAHVRWLGGGSGAGKTTVTAILAKSFGLRIYSTDAKIAAHGAGAELGTDAPLLRRFGQMSMDERWLSHDAKTMLQTFPWFAGERFDRIVHDLQSEDPHPPTLAEGFRLLPTLVRPLIDETRHAVWFIPSEEFRRAAFASRSSDEQFWRQTSDPDTALERLLQRDALFAEAVARDAERLQLKIIRIDGARDAMDLAEEVARWLRLEH